VWVPLAQPLPLPQAAALAHALARVLPTLDPAPLSNAPTGCMRPPGAVHAAGGHQVLHTPLPQALAALRSPNPAAVVDALWALAVPARTPAPTDAAAACGPPRPEQRQDLGRRWEVLAASGPRPQEFGGDASRARWHVTLAAVRAGWSADEWVAAIGGWPWMAQQLATPARLALARAEFEKAAGRWRTDRSVQIPDTSHQPLHGGGARGAATLREHAAAEDVHLALRRVRTWLHTTARSGRLSPSVQAVARAVLLFGHASTSSRIQVGVRALAVAAAVSRTTAADALWELHGAGLLTRVGRGIGRGADVWQIDLALGSGLAPARGRIWATRPVFRVIGGGHGAAEVYEHLAGAGGTAVSARAVAGALGRSPTTITAHLQELASWGLAAGGGRSGWAVGPADPDELAARLGAGDLVAAQVSRFRAERVAWWQWLAAKGLDQPTRRSPGLGQVLLLPDTPVHHHRPAARGDRAGPDALRLAVDLVTAEFGATLLPSA
jgi:hypothetical protein